MSSISVIIPSNHSHKELLKVVRALCGQTTKPFEIIIVDSAFAFGECPAEIKTVCNYSGIYVIYLSCEGALPGKARNIGISAASGELIAFIDVQTIPRAHWLEISQKLVTNHNTLGIWGSTCFSASNYFEKLVRDGFYGLLPRKTLPGSIFKREVFDKSGLFIDWARAGEDTEWILRLTVLRIPVFQPIEALTDYIGLIGTNLIKLLKKWLRNYKSASELPHFFPQKLLLWFTLYPMLVLIAFNWNYLIADWRMDSLFYIGHVTKIVATLPFLAYLILRGFVLPLRRGVRLWSLFPFRFIAIALICILADTVKIMVFLDPSKLLFKNWKCRFK